MAFSDSICRAYPALQPVVETMAIQAWSVLRNTCTSHPSSQATFNFMCQYGNKYKNYLLVEASRYIYISSFFTFFPPTTYLFYLFFLFYPVYPPPSYFLFTLSSLLHLAAPHFTLPHPAQLQNHSQNLA
jgi:hypothetical protein